MKANERRKLFTRLYHRARRRANQRLVVAHRVEFDSYMDEELKKVSTEDADAIEFVRAVKADLARD